MPCAPLVATSFASRARLAGGRGRQQCQQKGVGSRGTCGSPKWPERAPTKLPHGAWCGSKLGHAVGARPGGQPGAHKWSDPMRVHACLHACIKQVSHTSYLAFWGLLDHATVEKERLSMLVCIGRGCSALMTLILSVRHTMHRNYCCKTPSKHTVRPGTVELKKYPPFQFSILFPRMVPGTNPTNINPNNIRQTVSSIIF